MKSSLVLLLAFTIAGCINKRDSTARQHIVHMQSDSSERSKGSGKLKESFKEEDVLPNEYRKDVLKPIQDNFRRINTIPDNEWSLLFSKDLDEPGEGGITTFYFYNNSLEKIIARHYGETGETLIEYYLLEDRLSFVLERRLNYNRPYYYDAAAAKENNDTVAFDINKSEIVDDRSYFKDGVLLHQVSNQDCGAPFTKEYLAEEQKRILDEFDGLVRLSKPK